MNLCWYVQSCLSSARFKCSGRGTSHNIWGKLLLITAKKGWKRKLHLRGLFASILLLFFCLPALLSYPCILRVCWKWACLGWFAFFLFSSTKWDWLLKCVWSGTYGCAFVYRSTAWSVWRIKILVSGMMVSMSWQQSLGCWLYIVDRKLHKALQYKQVSAQYGCFTYILTSPWKGTVWRGEGKLCSFYLGWLVGFCHREFQYNE